MNNLIETLRIDSRERVCANCGEWYRFSDGPNESFVAGSAKNAFGKAENFAGRVTQFSGLRVNNDLPGKVARRLKIFACEITFPLSRWVHRLFESISGLGLS